MKSPDPMTVDFQALRTLCLVHARGSFSAAAQALDLNQSSISYTIDRLRRAFDDPLFVRQGARMSPTPRCKEIVASADQILQQYSAMVEPAEFDPATAEATLTISSNYYERVILLRPFARALHEQAPGIRLRMIQAMTEGEQHLRNAGCDILLTPMPLEETGLFTRTLISDRYVCILDPDNPVARAPITREIYAAARHALINYGDQWRSPYLVQAETQGIFPNGTLTIPSPDDMPGLIAGTDMISTVPARIAARMSDRLAVRECPFPAPFEISMYWSTRTHHTKMLLWARTLLAQTVVAMLRNESDIE